MVIDYDLPILFSQKLLGGWGGLHFMLAPTLAPKEQPSRISTAYYF